jgi:hypothetical protein
MVVYLGLEDIYVLNGTVAFDVSRLRHYKPSTCALYPLVVRQTLHNHNDKHGVTVLTRRVIKKRMSRGSPSNQSSE